MDDQRKLDILAHALQRVEGWWPQLTDPTRYCPVEREEIQAALRAAGYDIPSRRSQQAIEQIAASGYDIPPNRWSEE